MDKIEEYALFLKRAIKDNDETRGINDRIHTITMHIDNSSLNIEDRVKIATIVLESLDREQRISLCKSFIIEQIVNQREELSHWSTITAQSGMIDTGYIAQHLVSLCTKIPGQGMRGKGQDLISGSEVKSANFIDSKDKKGSTGPRWNFIASNDEKMRDFLHYTLIYLVSLDYGANNNVRIRIWEIDIRKHTALRKRYKEWMNDAMRKSRNFQLFPPKSGEDSCYARHGSNKEGSLAPTNIPLENVNGARKIFHAEIVNGLVEITTFSC